MTNNTTAIYTQELFGKIEVPVKPSRIGFTGTSNLITKSRVGGGLVAGEEEIDEGGHVRDRDGAVAVHIIGVQGWAVTT